MIHAAPEFLFKETVLRALVGARHPFLEYGTVVQVGEFTRVDRKRSAASVFGMLENEISFFKFFEIYLVPDNTKVRIREEMIP